jgi:uncharacterized protein (DUF1501 family)
MLIKTQDCNCSRRDFLRAGTYGLGVTAGLPLFLRHVSEAQAAGLLAGAEEKYPNRILVVLELSGGNDGLNTIVPWSDDAYYKARPTLAIKANDSIKLNDRFALHPAMTSFESLYPTNNSSLDFLNQVSRTATAGAALVRNACAEYKTMVDYGSDNDLTLDLKKVSGMIKAGLPTRIFYVSQGGYDTHAAQAGSQQTLLIYFADALRGFMEDLERIGRADDVAAMVFTEFGRRVNENLSRGADHGTATPMYIVGKKIKGGFYGKAPSLMDLDDGNLKMTTDFRSVYATMLKEWMGFDDTKTVLKGEYSTLGVFA